MKKYINITADGFVHSEVYLQDGVEPSALPGVTAVPVSIDFNLPQNVDSHQRYHLASAQWVDPRTLQDLKVAKWSQIKQARTAAIGALITTPSGTFDANEISRFGIERAASLADRTNAAVAFTLSTDEVVMLTAVALNQVSLMLGQREQAARNKATGLRTRIGAANAAAALDLIVW